MQLSLVLSALAALLLCHAALHDVVARTIPDLDSAALLALGIVERWLRGELVLSVLLGGAMFALCQMLWRRGWLGGGDVKLLCACCLLVAPARVPGMAGAVLCAGGVLGVLYLLAGVLVRRRMVGSEGTVPVEHGGLRSMLRRAGRREVWRLRRGAGLPYGVAISAAALLSVWSE